MFLLIARNCGAWVVCSDLHTGYKMMIACLPAQQSTFPSLFKVPIK